MVKDEFSTFNRHSAWFTQRGSQTLHETRAGELEHLWRRRAPSSAASNLPKWECVGPFNIAGRVTTLIAHPADPRRLWAGAAAGGVWTSVDSGANWKLLAAVGQPVHRRPRVRSGRPQGDLLRHGEANISPDCYPGSGVYASRDGGVTWDLFADADQHFLPRRIGVLLPCRHPHAVLYLGGVTLDEQIQPACTVQPTAARAGSARISSPAGTTGVIRLRLTRKAFCWPGWNLAVRRPASGEAEIMESGKQLRHGLPGGDKTGRISLAIAPSLPGTVYALVANRLGSQVLGVYRSRNGGERWQQVSGTHFAAEGQSSYNNTIAVHPADPDIVVCGLNDIHVSRDGGATWRRASRWDAGEGSPQYVHADQHAIVLPGGDLIYAANDGGVAVKILAKRGPLASADSSTRCSTTSM